MRFPGLLPLVTCLALIAGVSHAQLRLPGSPPSSTPPSSASPSAPAPPAAPPAPGDPASAAPAAPDREQLARQQEAQTAARGWLMLLDRQDWGRAWDTSGNAFRRTVPLAKWMDAIPKVRDPLGALVERTPVQAVARDRLEGQGPGDYISVVFNSRFGNKADAVEVVTMQREADGHWRVAGYLAR